jgi:hypothetical protein
MFSRTIHACVAAVIANLFSLAHAGIPTPAKIEIDALLNTLASSRCEFQRNGSWHTADQARTLMVKKLEYLDRKNMIKTAEDFIEHAGSKSSSTGKPYSVRCGDAAMDSGTWLTAQLKTLREKTKK